jgi:hypothetical protein
MIIWIEKMQIFSLFRVAMQICSFLQIERQVRTGSNIFKAFQWKGGDYSASKPLIYPLILWSSQANSKVQLKCPQTLSIPSVFHTSSLSLNFSPRLKSKAFRSYYNPITSKNKQLNKSSHIFKKGKSLNAVICQPSALLA